METGFLHQLVQQLINGISLGSIYALIALGYTMIYGILKLINFAHGDIYMLGAYIGFVCTSILKLSFLPALIISMLGAALAGIIIERIAYRPMRNAPRIAILITAIGVSFFLENVMILVASPQPRTFPAVFTATVYHVGSWVVNSQQIVILVSALVLMVALTYIVNQTKAGKAMRAVANNKYAASLMGINVSMNIAITIGLSAAICTCIGMLIIPLYNVQPSMTGMIGLKGLCAGVIGGFGYLPGAIVGGLVLGIVENMASMILPSMYKDCISFVLLIMFMLFRPSGILGRKKD